MLGDSAVLGGGGNSSGAGEGGSGDAVAAVASGEGATAAGGGSNSGDEERGRMVLEEGERSGSFGGNRWPRQETLALLRIRSDMDVAFRDASVKGPLWEDVSRKMAELGYARSAKKCKEKFENVYKYHKRTKEGRSGKADGKTYRFFDQLEAFENHPPPSTTHHHQSPKPPSQVATTTTTIAMPPPPPHVTVPSTTTTTTTTTAPVVMPQGTITISTAPSINLTIPSYPPPPTTTTTINPTSLFPHSTPNPTTATTNPLPPPPHTTIPAVSFTIPTDLLSNSSSSSTSSDETPQEGGSRKRKRKWKDFFERLMKEVVEKQEQLQKRFLEAIEKREQDRMAREEAWRLQEMQRINREREILAQERSIAAAKDAAVMSFLQKIAEQQNLGQPLNTITILQPHSQPQPVSVPQAPLSVQQQPPAAPVVRPVVQPVALAPQPQPQQEQVTGMEIVKVDNNNGENLMSSPSSSRWPKVEVQALIQLRTSLDAKYQENGPKGPLWEEISSSMRKLGYNRSSKRCKEKWENINKYFKKVKESNKKRPQDSKTCPYFHQLDALYREKNKLEGVTAAKPETMVAPLMVRPEQQWPPQPPDVAMEDAENDPMDTQHHQHHHHDDDDEDTEDIIGDEEDDEDESGGGGGNNYEIVASKPASAPE